MKQLVQDLQTHQVAVAEVPAPGCAPGGVFVRTAASLISSGTERATVRLGSRSLAGKAWERPDLVRTLFRKLRTNGVADVVATVRAKLDRALALGYSASGEVLEVGEGAPEFHAGQRVACAGMGYASHAEMLWVPKNLCVPIPEDVDYEAAAFVAVGSIALQGVRISEARLGERVAVVGLGLVGLITTQILEAAGCTVWGFDSDPNRVALAREMGLEKALLNSEAASPRLPVYLGGADSVIVAAASRSNDPVVLAGQLARDRGVVVIVGDVRVDVPREDYYRKELQLHYSRSYGPGRYDPGYEEKGVDYPPGYVRWTEGRNMQAFLSLLAAGKVDVRRLITHRFPIERAGDAYDLLMRKGKYVGILIKYPATEPMPRRIDLQIPPAARNLPEVPRGKVGIGWIGAGSFSRAKLLPALRKIDNVKLLGLANATGVSAARVGKTFGFEFCTTDARAVIEDSNIAAVFIGTRHHLHGPLVAEALENNKHVFVEKPLCVTEQELSTIANLYARSDRVLAVGFNRRFSPFAAQCREFFSGGRDPLSFIYRINAGRLPANHWVNDPGEGHGRIVSEVCHFVDLLGYLSDSLPIQVEAWPAGEPADEGNIHIQIAFADGSRGEIFYLSCGDESVSKERLEIFGRGRSAICEDFRESWFYRSNRCRHKKCFQQDKGHREELRQFIAAVAGKAPSPIPFANLWATTLATIRIRESLAGRGPRLVAPTAVANREVNAQHPGLTHSIDS